MLNRLASFVQEQKTQIVTDTLEYFFFISSFTPIANHSGTNASGVLSSWFNRYNNNIERLQVMKFLVM